MRGRAQGRGHTLPALAAALVLLLALHHSLLAAEPASIMGPTVSTMGSAVAVATQAAWSGVAVAVPGGEHSACPACAMVCPLLQIAAPDGIAPPASPLAHQAAGAEALASPSCPTARAASAEAAGHGPPAPEWRAILQVFLL